MKVFIYSHTHWDREWYLSQNQFQYRLVRTVDEILGQLQADGSFRVFVMDGQTCVLEDYLEIRPERRGLVESLVRQGRLVIGPWFTMPDTFLPDGESLIRNLLRGYRDCLEFGARYPNVGYVPDSFGHIEQLPQILRGAGLDNFVFSRGRPVALSGPGHHREFLWQAPDGSSVYAWHLPHGYTAGMFLPGPEQPEALEQRVETTIQAFAHSHRPEIAVIPHGIDHCWLQLDAAAILAVLPRLRPDVEFHHGSLEDALDAWKEQVPANLETYQGQLRGRLGIGELHGTLSSRIDNKLWNERAQVHLEALAEPLDAIAARFGRPPAPHFLRQAWRRLFHNHAHDSICGCSQDRVHEDVNRRFREATELGIDIADGALDYLNNSARQARVPTVVVFAGLNGGNRVVDFVIRLPERPHGGECFVAADGKAYPAQFESVTHMRVQHTNGEVRYWECRGCVWLPDLLPAEVRRLEFAASAAQTSVTAVAAPAGVSGRSLANGRLWVTVNADGTLDLEAPAIGPAIRSTHFVVQEADLGGGYHFEPLPGDVRRDNRQGRARVRVLARGPIRACLEVETRLRVPQRYDRTRRKRLGRATIPIRSRLTLEAGSDVVKITTTLANSAWNQRLRLALPTGMAATTVAADASFAVHENHPARWPADERQNSHPCRSFVSISEAGTGLTVMGRGLHEYEIVPTPGGTNLEITLLRSVDFVFLCSTWATPEARLLKELTYEYALCLHAGDWRAAGIPTKVAAYRAPAIAEVHGDLGNPRDHEPHATIGFYAERNGVELPVDTNRSAWKVINANRDGWRRVEPERFVSGTTPRQIVPFRIEGEQIVVSAFKRADDGRGEILRFWTASGQPQSVAVVAEPESTAIVRTDLLERDLPQTQVRTGRVSFEVRPFEIVTLRLQAPPA